MAAIAARTEGGPGRPLRLRHFGDAAARKRPSAPPDAPRAIALAADPAVGLSLLPSAAGRINHLLLAASSELPGAEGGMLQRLLALAGMVPQVSLLTHAREAEALRAMVPGAEIVAVPDGTAL